MRPYQLATAAILILIAAVAMFDTGNGALPDPSGRAPGGLRGGWYPFWSSALMAVAGIIVLYRVFVTPQPAQGIFRDRQAVLDVLKLVVPMVLVAVAMGWLGFYITAALYLGFFARAIGRYGWPWTIVSAIAIPVALYLLFELGFKVSLPKSLLFPFGSPL